MNDSNFINVVSGKNASVDRALNSAAEKDKVVLYFGGGLSSNSYMRNKLGPYLLNTIFDPHNLPKSHPIIAIWETGITETDSVENIFEHYLGTNNVKSILGKKNVEKIRNWLKRKLKGKDKGLKEATPESESALNILKSIGFTEDQIYSDSDLPANPDSDLPAPDYEMESKLKSLYKDDGEDLREGINSLNKSIEENNPEKLSRKNTLLIIYKVLKRYVLKTHHGAYTTIIEELLRHSKLDSIPQGHWEQVYTTSGRMWKENTGKYLLKKLNELSAQKELIIDLVSHSAGAIAICHLIQELATGEYPNIKIGNILPIAPAVTTKLFENTIIENNNAFESFRMFALTDEMERDDNLLNVVYPRSLLYFVSGVAEIEGKGDMGIVGMHRYFSNGIYFSKRYKKSNI